MKLKNDSHFNILNMIAKIIADINLHSKLLFYVLRLTIAEKTDL